jgi:hypothetical protein
MVVNSCEFMYLLIGQNMGEFSKAWKIHKKSNGEVRGVFREFTIMKTVCGTRTKQLIFYKKTIIKSHNRQNSFVVRFSDYILFHQIVI